IDLGHELVAQHEPAMVLNKFCRAAQTIIDASEVMVAMFEDDPLLPRHVSRCRRGKVSRGGKMSPTIQKALKRVVEERAPVRLNESDDLLLDSTSVQSFLGAPIISASGASGWFCLLNKRGADEFSEADEKLAATLAAHVAVAYENATLYEEAQNHATELRMEMAVRKQAEEERARLLVREKAARAEAEAANRNKDEFLATLSHVLRTPLTAILGWSHLMRTKRLNEGEVTRALDTIERNARAQSQLFDDLLDVSRIITGKLEIDYAVVDLGRVLDAAFDSVRPAVEAKSIEFSIASDSTRWCVGGDPNRLQQIFWNLFSNAVKFTPKGGQVKVELSGDDSVVQVAVIDSGIGIKPDFLPFI